ncbi:transglutaminase-like domain-containing protein [Halovulum sp. GXIMD14793]
MSEFVVEVKVAATGAPLIAPVGMNTPQATIRGSDVSGGTVREITETHTGQTVLLVAPTADQVLFRYSYDDQPGAYPQAMFTPIPSRFTRAAEDLLAEAVGDAGTGDDLSRSIAVACATAERFTYGHPEERFNDGLDEVPALGCGLAEGSCVDINTYFIAALRACGIRAGYVTGAFFPAEKRDWCSDMHCWVVTEIDSQTQEWDIAHHLKLGTRDIRPALNPKPGFRAAVAHSMGLDLPEAGAMGIKLLSEPVEVIDGKVRWIEDKSIRLIGAQADIQGTAAE